MKKYEITWFEDFSCLCGSCPQTCCRGWVIPLDDRDRERFGRVKGLLGIRLFFARGGWTGTRFNKDSGTCPFYGRDGLCALQKEKGHDFIPWTCQSYPRFYRNYGTFEECCLDLSCIGAARLFIENGGSLEMTESEGDPVTRSCTTNDDGDYLEFLQKNRREMTGMAATSVSGIFADILFKYAIVCQDHFFAGEQTKGVLPGFGEFYESMVGRMPGSFFGFPLPGKVLKGFLNSSLCHQRLRKVDPHLFGMFAKARSLLGRAGSDEEKWQGSAKEYLKNDPFLKTVLGNYLAYYLYQYWLRTYETYSFRRQTALGLCHLNMVLLLMMATDDESGNNDAVRMAEVIAAYNRRAYFNDGIQDEMYRIFEDNYKLFIQNCPSL